MQPDISPTTGKPFYSGSHKEVTEVAKALRLGGGAAVSPQQCLSQEMVNRFQETVDRSIDGILADTYFTPFVAMNRYMPDGTTKAVYPGELVRAAKYWAAGLVLMAQYSSVDSNQNDWVNVIIEDAKKNVFRLRRLTQHLEGQKPKGSHWGHTMPPTMTPPVYPEGNDWI